jgi:hypothetical protein
LFRNVLYRDILIIIFKIGKYKGKKSSGKSYTRVIWTEIYHLLGMKSFRDDLIDRMKTGCGRLVLASKGGRRYSAPPPTLYSALPGVLNKLGR